MEKPVIVFVLSLMFVGPSFAAMQIANIVGIGAVLDVMPSKAVKVTDVVPGSPAQINGLQKDDIILSVQKDPKAQPVNISGMKLEEIVAMIRGPKGVAVTLKLKKPSGETKTLIIMRDEFTVEHDEAK